MPDFSPLKPDALFIELLKFLGLPPLVISLVTLVLFILAWYAFAQTTKSLSQKVGRSVRSTSSTLASLTPVSGPMSVAITTLVIATQALTVGLCFLGGNYASMVFHPERWSMMAEVIEQHPESFFYPEHLFDVLTVDWASGAYTLLALVIIVRSYDLTYDTTGKSVRRAGALLAWPATLLLPLVSVAVVVGLLLLALIFLLTLVSQSEDVTASLEEGLTAFLPLLIGGVICLAYYAACQAAVRGSKLVVRAWTTREDSSMGKADRILRRRQFIEARGKEERDSDSTQAENAAKEDLLGKIKQEARHFLVDIEAADFPDMVSVKLQGFSVLEDIKLRLLKSRPVAGWIIYYTVPRHIDDGRTVYFLLSDGSWASSSSAVYVDPYYGTPADLSKEGNPILQGILKALREVRGRYASP